jgi:predicted amidophosphoribosyltransferase
MALIDGLVVFGAIGLVILSVLGVRTVKRKAKPEIKGAENAEEVKAASRRRCHFCKKDTAIDDDIYTEGHWYHRKCYLNDSETKN